MHWLSGEGIVLWANQTELNVLGYTAEEYIGQPIMKFCPDEEELVLEIFKQLGSENTIKDLPVRFRTKDGRVVDLLIDSNVKYDHHGQFGHTRCFIRDDTGRKIREARARLLLHETKRSLRQLDHFMSRYETGIRSTHGVVHRDQTVIPAARPLYVASNKYRATVLLGFHARLRVALFAGVSLNFFAFLAAVPARIFSTQSGQVSTCFYRYTRALEKISVSCLPCLRALLVFVFGCRIHSPFLLTTVGRCTTCGRRST